MQFMPYATCWLQLTTATCCLIFLPQPYVGFMSNKCWVTHPSNFRFSTKRHVRLSTIKRLSRSYQLCSVDMNVGDAFLFIWSSLRSFYGLLVTVGQNRCIRASRICTAPALERTKHGRPCENRTQRREDRKTAPQSRDVSGSRSGHVRCDSGCTCFKAGPIPRE